MKIIFIVLSALATITYCNASAADVLSLRSSAIAGKVLSIDTKNILFSHQCNATKTISVPWSDVAEITFDDNCDASLSITQFSESPLCESDPIRVFELEMAQGHDTVFAEGFALIDGRVHFSLFDPPVNVHGPESKIRTVKQQLVCRESVPYTGTFDQHFCVERKQYAVLFDYDTPLSNRILTNGFSFHLKVDGTPPEDFDVDSVAEDIRRAFQVGLTLWLEGLRENKRLVDTETQEFLGSRVFPFANGATLVLSPQVVRVGCPDTAIFQVILITENNDVFKKNSSFLAKAQIEGRTIALNFADFPCQKTEIKFYGENKSPKFNLGDNCINLLPIMTHELGHAFGLRHLDGNESLDLMDSRFSRKALVPTIRDIEAFASVLSKSIKGDSPGVLAFESAGGVLPPLDGER